MVGYLKSAETWLRAVRASHLKACDTWTTQYSRGLATLGLAMTQAETRFQTDDGQTIVNSAAMDWIIDRADMVAVGLNEPQPGDRITIVLEHGSEVFEVAAIGGEPAWRWHGRDGQTFRIHTVRI